MFKNLMVCTASIAVVAFVMIASPASANAQGPGVFDGGGIFDGGGVFDRYPSSGVIDGGGIFDGGGVFDRNDQGLYANGTVGYPQNHYGGSVVNGNAMGNYYPVTSGTVCCCEQRRGLFGRLRLRR